MRSILCRDYWKQDWVKRGYNPNPEGIPDLLGRVTRVEFESLKKEVEALRDLLKEAVKFDKATNQPSCETESKIALIKALAKEFGVDMEEVFNSE